MNSVRATAAIAAAASVLLLAAPAGAQSTAPAGAQADDPVVATVNGADIHRSDVETAREQLPEQYRDLPIERVFEPILNQLIRSKLIAQQAREAKLQETESYKRRISMFEERLLEEAYLRKMIGEKITEAALRERYDAAIGQFPTAEEVRARHILVKTKEEAEAIIAELDGGADFAKLAAEKSIGPSKSRGGDLDYFGRGQMVKPFEDAAFGLKAGEVSAQPVQSPFGWHVIKVEDRRQSEPPTFEEARGKIGEEMSQEVAGEVIKNLTESADIQRFELDGSTQRMRRVTPEPAR